MKVIIDVIYILEINHILNKNYQKYFLGTYFDEKLAKGCAKMSRDIQLGGRPSSSKQSKFKPKNVEFQAQKKTT